MKICPECGASYSDFVDFCFEDGSLLEVPAAAAPAEVDDFDVPLVPGSGFDLQDPGAPDPEQEETWVDAEPLTDETSAELPPTSFVPGGASSSAEATWMPEDDYEPPPVPAPTPAPAERAQPPAPTPAPASVAQAELPPVHREEPKPTPPVRPSPPPPAEDEGGDELVAAGGAALLGGGMATVVLGGAVALILLGLVGAWAMGIFQTAPAPTPAPVPVARPAPRPPPPPPAPAPAPVVEPAPDAPAEAGGEGLPVDAPGEPPAPAPAPAEAPVVPPPAPAEPVPAPAPPAPADPPPAPAPAPTPPPPAPSEAASAPSAAGEVVVKIETDPPGATVLVDGVRVGESPVDHTLLTGTHIIRLSKSGYKPMEVRQNISSGGPMRFSLQAVGFGGREASFVFNSSAFLGESLFVDGRELCSMPCTEVLAEGVYTFSVPSKGWTGTRELSADSTKVSIEP